MTDTINTFAITISFKNKRDAETFFYAEAPRFNLTNPMNISNEDGTALGVTVEGDPQLVKEFYRVLQADDSVIDFDSEE